jgi:hypothetical protein
MAKKVVEKSETATAKVQESAIRVIAKIEQIVNVVPQVQEVLGKLSEEVEKIKSDLSLGVREYELEIEGRRKELDSILATKQAEFKTLTEQDSKTYQDLKEALKTSHNEFINKLSKEKEEAEYESKKAIDRVQLETANEIAKKTNKVLVDKAEYDSVVKQSKENLVKSEEEVKVITNKAKQEVYVELNPKLKDLESKLQSETTLLKKELELANKQLVQSQENEKYLKEQLAKVPQQIKEAVEAAKVQVSNNTYTTK